MDDSDRLLAIQMLLHAQHLSLTAVYIYPCGQSASEKRQHYQHAKLLHGRCSEAGGFQGGGDFNGHIGSGEGEPDVVGTYGLSSPSTTAGGRIHLAKTCMLHVGSLP